MSSKKGSSKPSSDYRSAVTGRFVSERFAKSHPKTTVKENNKKK